MDMMYKGLAKGISRESKSGGDMVAEIVAIMFINGEKLASRDAPFMPEDLAMASEANSLSDMVNWGKLFSALTTIAVILIACFFINKWLYQHIIE